MSREPVEPQPEFTEEEKARWEAMMNPRQPDWISISNIKLLSLKHRPADQIALELGLESIEGIPLAIDDSLGSDPGFVLRYLDE